MPKLEPGLTFLLVDDAEVVRKIVRKMLLAFHVNEADIEEAENGKEALSKIEAKNGGYDFVILDWSMPVMSGIEVLKRVREHEKKDISSTRVVMVTAEHLKKYKESAEGYGVDGYITKPFDVKKLYRTLRGLTKNSTRQ